MGTNTRRWPSVVVVAIVLAGGAGASWWWYVAADDECREADRNAADLFDRHELVQSLKLVDEVDGRCDCARFTSGDAPPQYAIAWACLRQLDREGRGSEAREVLASARSPMLKSLAKAADGGY